MEEYFDMMVEYSKYMRLFVLWVMLFSKKEDFVWEIKNEMEMCFWAAKMMKFQNNGVWERWVMDNGVL